MGGLKEVGDLTTTTVKYLTECKLIDHEERKSRGEDGGGTNG